MILPNVDGMQTSTAPATAVPRWAVPVVILLTVLWLTASALLGWRWLTVALEWWSDQHSGGGVRSDELVREGMSLTMALVAVAVGSPLLISVLAFVGRLRKTAVVYAVLAVLFGVLAIPFVTGGNFRY